MCRANEQRGKLHKGKAQKICIGPFLNLLLNIRPQMHRWKLQEVNLKEKKKEISRGL